MKKAFALISSIFFWGALWCQVRKEEKLDYYQKWLKQDVIYIISDEETEVFEKLTTNEEKDHFIEQFWFRRDPDPRTSLNEFKDEHYRRVAYVNEKFGSGVPGWKTDRGRIYIALGPPDWIEDHPSGGTYIRPKHEGGGETSTYPFQIWRYNFIEGVGDDIQIEFVDPSWAGEYRMALEPWEKDALLHAGGAGPTDLELEGRLTKRDRPYFSPGNYRNSAMQARLGMRAKDQPFEKMIRFYQFQKPPPIQFSDLKQAVATNVTFQQFPFQAGYDYLNVDSQKVLVPVTLEFENKNLSFGSHQDGRVLENRLDIYGVVQNLTGRIVTEFEDTLVKQIPATEKQKSLLRKSSYQKMLLLEPGRYKLTLAVKDQNSEQVGTRQIGLHLPSVRQAGLDSSSLILARLLEPLEMIPEEPLPFVLGDLKVIPNVARVFDNRDDLGLYLQAYNVALDQSTQQPALEIEFQILRDGEIVKSYFDPRASSTVSYENRVLLLGALDLDDLAAGDYTVAVKLLDRIQNAELVKKVPFRVVSSL